jgi:hypothetical protein
MKTGITLGLLVGLAGSSMALGGQEVQTVPFAWDVQESNTAVLLDYDGFDDMGGTRNLTGVSFSFESLYSLNMLAENGEDQPISSDQWFIEAVTLFQMGLDELFLGALDVEFIGLLSADLAANDGVPMEGPDSIAWGFEGAMSGSVNLAESEFYRFTNGALTADAYPFLSLAISAPPPFFDLYITDHIHTGSVSLTYEFDVVPAPGSAVLFFAAALGVRRRRR